MTASTSSRQQAGFSLIELMTAMLITLIVSGAIYGLMASGQGTFRREPQLTDRQQNIRIAMDLIENDVINAGRGLPHVSQVFTNGLDGGANADDLEMVIGSSLCPSWTVCEGATPVSAATAAAATNYITLEPTAGNACLAPTPGGTWPLVMLADSRYFSLHQSAAGAGGVCQAGGANGSLTLNPAVAGSGWGATGVRPISLYAAQLVRYQLTAPDGQGIRDLRRSDRGGGALADWQVVARGIEDLQVQYTNGAGEADTPGVIAPCIAAPPGCTAAENATIVTSVRITLRSRTIAPNILGAAGDHAVRGNLTTIVSPRAAVTALEVGGLYN